MWMKVISEFFLWIDMNTSWRCLYSPHCSPVSVRMPSSGDYLQEPILTSLQFPAQPFWNEDNPKSKVDDWPNDRRRRRARLVSEFDLLPKYGKHTRNLLYQVQPVQRTINKNGQQRETKQEDGWFAEGLSERRHGPHSFRLACKFRDKERRKKSSTSRFQTENATFNSCRKEERNQTIHFTAMSPNSVVAHARVFIHIVAEEIIQVCLPMSDPQTHKHGPETETSLCLSTSCLLMLFSPIPTREPS